jgi:hypothetical protein
VGDREEAQTALRAGCGDVLATVVARQAVPQAPTPPDDHWASVLAARNSSGVAAAHDRLAPIEGELRATTGRRSTAARKPRNRNRSDGRAVSIRDWR